MGTSLLRAYMHGFFIDNRLYNKAKWVRASGCQQGQGSAGFVCVPPPKSCSSNWFPMHLDVFPPVPWVPAWRVGQLAPASVQPILVLALKLALAVPDGLTGVGMRAQECVCVGM